MADDLVLEDARTNMEKSLEGLQRDMAKIRTGRANPAILEGIQVDYYGTPTPLKSLATLSAPEARLLTIQPFDPGALAGIEKAILKSNLGLTPASDGKILRVPIPELTEERRRDFVKHLKKVTEDHKLGVRHARRDALSLVKEMEKDHEISEDDSHRLQKKIQDLTDDFVKKIDQAMESKEQDILKV